MTIALGFFHRICSREKAYSILSNTQICEGRAGQLHVVQIIVSAKVYRRPSSNVRRITLVMG